MTLTDGARCLRCTLVWNGPAAHAAARRHHRDSRHPVAEWQEAG